MPNLSFRGQGELSMGLQLQQKDENHTAISHSCQARSQVGAKGAVISPIFEKKKYEKSQMLSKNCHDRLKPVIYPTELYR